MINNIITWIKSRAAYAHTYRELSSLSARELHDIGIDAASINDIASEAAQKVLQDGGFKSFSELFSFAKLPTEKDRAYAWLSDSSDMVDLERRIKLLDQNNAPWQAGTNRNLQGWAQ